MVFFGVEDGTQPHGCYVSYNKKIRMDLVDGWRLSASLVPTSADVPLWRRAPSRSVLRFLVRCYKEAHGEFFSHLFSIVHLHYKKQKHEVNNMRITTVNKRANKDGAIKTGHNDRMITFEAGHIAQSLTSKNLSWTWDNSRTQEESEQNG